MQGYIKLHRQITEWEWYNNINVCRLFIHCLLKANHKAKKWQGQVIQAGSFITSYEKLSIETGLSIHQVRTALNKLKMTNEVAYQSTSQYSIITIKNWDRFQMDGKQNGNQMANEWQTDGKQMATTNNDKNVKNENNNLLSKPEKKEILDYVSLLGKKIAVDDFIAYYEAAEWKDKDGLPVNWKQKAIQWANRYKPNEKANNEPSEAFNEFYKKEKARLAAKGIY